MSSRSVLVWTGVLAAVWLIAAVSRENTTLHLGPLLLPIVAAVLGRHSNHALSLTVIGAGTSAAIIALLSVTGNLDGPSLGPFPDAVSESVAFLGAGTLVGVAVGLTGRPLLE